MSDKQQEDRDAWREWIKSPWAQIILVLIVAALAVMASNAMDAGQTL